MKVKDQQNIFDVTLNNYGSLNQLIRLAAENNLLLDAAPAVGTEIAITTGIGQNRVLQFVGENDFIYNNSVVEANAALLAGPNTALSPKIDVIFIYK